MKGGLHIGLLFTKLTAAFTAQETQRRQPRRFMQPAFQDGVRAQTGGFAREDDKDRLRDFLGVGGNPGMAERRRINQVDMVSNQFGKGFLRALPLVIPQQVAHIGHLPIYCRWTRNQTFIFSIFSCSCRRRRADAFANSQGAEYIAKNAL